MSAYSFRPPSSEGATAIRKVAHRILTKDYPLTGWLREITPQDAIAQASEEIIKKLTKKGLRAAKRDKRTREGLPPKEKKKRKKKEGTLPPVNALDALDEVLGGLLPGSKAAKKEEVQYVEPQDSIDKLLEEKKKKKRKKKEETLKPIKFDYIHPLHPPPIVLR